MKDKDFSHSFEMTEGISHIRSKRRRDFSHSFEKTERFLTFVRNDRACHSERPAGVEESLRLIERLEMTERFLTFVRNDMDASAGSA